MDIVIGIIIFVVGAAAGFFTSRMNSASNQDNQKLAEKATQTEASLAQYKLDVAEHLDHSTQLLEQMNTTCQKAMAQMEQSTQLLQQATQPENETMPFFSKETQEQLAQTVALRHNKRERKDDKQMTEAPLDYSGESTGLFADKKQPVTNDKVDS